MKKMIFPAFLMCGFFSLQAQIFTPVASIQGTSNSNNIGIGISIPSASLHIRTATANFLIENSGIEGAYMTINSGRFNRPAITSYKQVGTEYWNSGILYDESGNQKYSIGTTQELSSSRLTIQTDGNIGLSTTTPSSRLQIGEFNNTQNLKLGIPGVYNFEQIKLGQYGNGSGALEIVNHRNATESYGVRLYSNTDSGINGLQIQTAAPSNSYENLSYITRLAVDINGDIGIGTITPKYKLDVIGTIRAREIKVDLTGADFVFEKDYKLMPLDELEKFVKDKKHLPEIATALEMKKNGTELGILNSKLLQKIEEMTLYMIEQEKNLRIMQKENMNFEKRLILLEQESK